MLTNYLLVAVRHLRRNKVFSLVNLAGLSIGLATFLVIVIFATFHKNFDTYHKDADRIVRLGMRVRLGGELVTLPTVGAPAARAFVNDIPEVEAATRIYGRGTFHFEVKNGDKVFSGEQGLFADPNFFDFFSIPIKAGSNSAMLTEPKSIVLTEDMVQKYFGEGTTNESVIGRVLEITNIGQVTVTAVCANVPAETHFDFDMLLSGDCNPENENPFWLANGFHTYVKLIPGSSDASLHNKFPDFADKYIGPEITQFLGVSFSEFLASGGSFEFTTMPMQDIHLWSHAENELAANVNGTYINLFLVIGFLILLLAVINFVNLSAASNIQRMKEVGVRKVMGAQKGALVFQFITESVLITFVAFCLGLTIQQAATPYLSQYYGMQMGLESMSVALYLSITLAGCLLIGTAAGIYPAILLSSAKTTLALKGQASAQSTKSKMRNSLLVVQFCITIGLVSSVLVILAQVNYLQTKELGFQKDGILLISGIDRLEQTGPTLRHELAKLPGAEAVSITNFVPSGPHEYEQNAMQNPEQENPETFRVTHVGVDEHYLDAMKMKLLVGRNFSSEFGDEASNVIINATMCRKYGWDVASGEALGKTVVEVDHNTPFKVIGVVEDFHIMNMTEPIRPFFFRHSPGGFLAVIRFNAENASLLQVGVDSFLADFTQVELTQSFLGDHFLRNFEGEQRVSSLFEMFALLAIILSGMGLFAMTAFVTYQRTKEIGIRKVLGAGGWQLFWMLSRQVVVMIAVASVIATPVVYLGMDRWLQEYAYRIQVPVWAIALPLLGMIAFALVVSGSHILKVININPVESLRDE